MVNKFSITRLVFARCDYVQLILSVVHMLLGKFVRQDFAQLSKGSHLSNGSISLKAFTGVT